MGWFMGEVVGDAENGKKIDLKKVKYGMEVLYCLVPHICLVQKFSAQWRDNMRKTPKVILGCFRGLGKM